MSDPFNRIANSVIRTIAGPSDIVNSLSPFSVCQTNINSDTSLYVASASAGGPTGSAGGGTSISNAEASVTCTESSVIQAEAHAISLNTFTNPGLISNTTYQGANLYIGSADGVSPNNAIFAETSTFKCQYNLTCQLFNGLAPPIVFSRGFNDGQTVFIPGGQSSNTYNLPPLHSLGYNWAVALTPWVVPSSPYYATVNGDVMTFGTESAVSDTLNFNLIASASKP
jgi:hypothetical protein